MAPRDELRAALRRALKARTFDPKACLDLAKALRASGLDPIANMDFAVWTRHLRQLEMSAPMAQRARLAGALDRIDLDRSLIAIVRRGAGHQTSVAR